MFCGQVSIANVTRCWGASFTCARANWEGTFVVKQSLMLKLPKWYIYDFDPRQCLAMPASSDKAPMPWHKLLSLESMRSGWAGRSLAAAFQI